MGWWFGGVAVGYVVRGIVIGRKKKDKELQQ